MKLLTFRFRGQSERLGTLWNQRVIDLNAAYRWYLKRQDEDSLSAWADAIVPSTMLDFLRGGKRSLQAARDVVDSLDTMDVAELKGMAEGGASFSIEEVQFLAPVPRPTKIICLGLNYRDHAAEVGAPVPETPVIFAKFPSSVIGPGQPIVLPVGTSAIDYEAEMAFVIGQAGKHISRERALKHVAGYTILNDVSAREWQRRTSQWIVGKTPDTFCPMGPWLATPDEVPDPGAMGLKLSIGGDLLQQSTTAQMVFSVEDIVEYLSSVFSLEPGDVVATGTPGGVGSVRKPPRWLRPGDVVRIELQGVGVLENPVKAST